MAIFWIGMASVWFSIPLILSPLENWPHILQKNVFSRVSFVYQKVTFTIVTIEVWMPKGYLKIEMSLRNFLFCDIAKEILGLRINIHPNLIMKETICYFAPISYVILHFTTEVSCRPIICILWYIFHMVIHYQCFSGSWYSFKYQTSILIGL